MINALPRFYHLVIEHLAANKRVGLPRFLAWVFIQSTHLIYSGSQDISGGFRVKLLAEHGTVKNNKLAVAVLWSVSVLQFTDASAKKQGNLL